LNGTLSTSLGRPYPLKGKYFANVFIHFEPDPNDKENEKGFPSYILEESEEAKRYLRKSRAERFRHRRRQAGDHGQHESHFAAQSGDIDALMRITDDESEALHAKDNNGWMPIHEAARSGHADVLDYLLKQGADINSVTSSGQSPLALAKAFFDENHGIIDILETYGAIEIGPEL
jgi:prolyl 4-hydroxylase